MTMTNYRQTSRMVWESMLPVSAHLDLEIMDTLHAFGEEGITCEGIEGLIGRSHQSVSANLRHLVERRLAEPSDRHGVTASGRRAMMWRVACVELESA